MAKKNLDLIVSSLGFCNFCFESFVKNAKTFSNILWDLRPIIIGCKVTIPWGAGLSYVILVSIDIRRFLRRSMLLFLFSTCFCVRRTVCVYKKTMPWFYFYYWIVSYFCDFRWFWSQFSTHAIFS